MPIYAYRCEHCGFQQDVLRKMSDPPLVSCPSCGEPTFRKQVTAAGFQLKGSGWYVTDFRDQAKKDGKKKPDDAAPSDAPATTEKSDAAPSPAADSAPPPAPSAAPAPAAPAPSPKPAAAGGDAT